MIVRGVPAAPASSLPLLPGQRLAANVQRMLNPTAAGQAARNSDAFVANAAISQVPNVKMAHCHCYSSYSLLVHVLGALIECLNLETTREDKSLFMCFCLAAVDG